MRIISTPKIIFDNVHGNIKLTNIEREIIDTKIFQRLRRISQLALAEFVFPGATHNRFAHSLGTMYTISEMFDSLKENVGDRISIPDEDKQIIRLVGLLHDLGHLPFSHVFEDLLYEETGKTHEDLTLKFIKESKISNILNKNKDMDVDLLYNILEKNFIPNEEHELNYVSLIDGNLDADKLDYLKRDSIHTGVSYGSIDVERILKTISVDDKGLLCILNKGRLALENLCIARYHMFQTVYLHKTVVAFEKMLERLYDKLRYDKKDKIFPFIDVFDMDENKFGKYDDSYVWNKIHNYKGIDQFIIEIKDMLLSHNSIKLVVDDPILIDPKKDPDRALNLIKYEVHQKSICEKFEEFNLDWLFIADSRTKFRKSDYSNDPIQIEFNEENGLKYKDVSELDYSIMNQLQKEFTNLQVFTHQKYKEKLTKTLKELHFIKK